MASYARLLTVAGSRNLRDLGGYRAMDGRRVRRGMLLRSGHPGELTAEGARQFAALGLAAILDLRTTEERAGQPYPPGLAEGLHYWTRDYDLSRGDIRSEEHTSELQSLMRISYAVFCLKKKKN